MKLSSITRSRLKEELLSPSRPFTRKILDKLHSIRSLSFLKKINSETNPVLIWDIRSNPITFDFCMLIIDASNFFRKFKKNKYDLIIFIPNGYKPKPFSWNSYDKFFTSDDLQDRINNMIVPLAKSFSCVQNIIFESDEKILSYKCKKSLIYPPNYNPFIYYPSALKYSNAISSIKNANIDFIPFIRSTIDKQISKTIDNPYVTLTLRDHGYSPTRNSSQEDINQFIEFAHNLNCIPLIIPDDIDKLSEYIFPNNIIIYKDHN